MLDPVRAKLRILGVTAATFMGGILLASGMQWTTGVEAAVLLQQVPDRSQTQPMAELSEAFVAVSEAVTPAVVSIQTARTVNVSERQREREIPQELRDMLPPQPDQIPGGGTGFLITPDGYVMTNNHVVEGASSILVTLNDRSVHEARLIGGDPTTDVAVIKVEGRGLPVIRFGEPNRTRVGEWVLAIGNPLGLDFTVTAGIVSAQGRPLDILRRSIIDSELAGYAVETFIQTDAAINPGNSGGPLVNIHGEVIGINSAIMSQTGLSTGYGFAVPIDLARRVADDLIRYGGVRRAVLGVRIEDVDANDAEYFSLPSVSGVLVQDFSMPDSPAEQAGLQRTDVIIAVDGEPVTQVNQLQTRILARRPGDTVRLDLIREGSPHTVEVRLIEAPNLTARSAAPAPAPQRGTVSPTGLIGLTVEPSSAEQAQQARCGRLVEPERGILVVADTPGGSPAAQANIGRCHRIIAVGGSPVETPQELSSALDGSRAGQVVGLTLLAGDGSVAVATVRIPTVR